jgi:glycosyltransferase involved in cell wall biosynthesis
VLSNQWHHKLGPCAPRARWRVVQNGIAMPRNRVHTCEERPNFLFLGDWTKRKGVHDLIRASEIANRRGFHGTVSLAGFEKEPGQQDRVMKLTSDCGCEQTVRMLGTVSGAQKEDALAKASCLVLPSYAEGLPMAILEAMSWEIPVIATNVGAIAEVVTEGQEGFLIEPGDVEALADRMLRIEKNPEMRQRMGQAARKRVETEFSLDAMAERIMGIYREVLS